jgi:pimeloyl-ACP methyl ester carboxylesterase
MPVRRDGNTGITYWAPGRTNPDGKKNLLFIHGAGGNQSSWAFQKAFFESDFFPVFLDLPGHGESEDRGEQSIETYALKIHSFMVTLGMERPCLIGHSMGGAIVQALALTYPEKIGGIVLVATGAKLRTFPAVMEGLQKDFKETVKKIVQYAFVPGVSREMLEGGIAFLMRCPPDVLYGDFLACDRFDLMGEVGNIRLPALVVCGEMDLLTPPKYSEFLHRQIPSSRLEIIPEAGHMVMMESPERFNEKVKRFLLDIR